MGIISESPTTPQRLSLISHEWLGCCDVWNHGRCETGCETVVISYVIALWRLGGLNHARHSPLAANHAANDKWNIQPSLVTMAYQGQDLKRIANANKQCYRCLAEELLLHSFVLVLYKPKAEAGYKPDWKLLKMTLDGWLEWNIGVVSNCDALMRSDLKGLVRRRHADRCCCARCLLLSATPHCKYRICSLRAPLQERFLLIKKVQSSKLEHLQLLSLGRRLGKSYVISCYTHST